MKIEVQIWTGLLTLEVGYQLKRVFITWVAGIFLAFHFGSTKASSKETEALFKKATLEGAEKDKTEKKTTRK